MSECAMWMAARMASPDEQGPSFSGPQLAKQRSAAESFGPRPRTVSTR
jgi:hypothetical protein